MYDSLLSIYTLMHTRYTAVRFTGSYVARLRPARALWGENLLENRVGVIFAVYRTLFFSLISTPFFVS